MALPGLAVLLLVAVVAIASSGSTPTGSTRSRSPSDSLLDAFFTLYLLGIVAGGCLLVYGLAQRKAIRKQVASGRYGRVPVSTWILALVVFGLLTYFRARNWKPQPQEPSEEQAFPGQPPLPGTTRGRKVLPYEAQVSWLTVGGVIVLVVAAIVAYALYARRSRVTVDRHEDLAEQLALALDDALDDLRAEADPRRAIIAAYARMERVLGASGVPRRSAETPDEYLARVLSELAPESDAVSRLTSLFTRAKFSHHVMDATMKNEAIEALENVRDELRGPATASLTTASEAPVGAPS